MIQIHNTCNVLQHKYKVQDNNTINKNRKTSNGSSRQTIKNINHHRSKRRKIPKRKDKCKNEKKQEIYNKQVVKKRQGRGRASLWASLEGFRRWREIRGANCPISLTPSLRFFIILNVIFLISYNLTFYFL